MSEGAAPPPRRQIGPYRVLRLLGRGSQAQVFLARRKGSRRPIALKVLAPQSDDDLARAEREVAIVRALAHPRIVRLLDAGRADDGRIYLALPRLHGETLAARVARGPLPVADVVAIGRQVADALAHAHALGIVHRDLKPSNIFLVDDEGLDARVLDFGLAGRVDASAPATPGALLGTPAYMSPEQARGDRDIDARADVWGLAAVLYECLAGAPPFHGDSVLATLYRVAFEEPPPLAAQRADVPDALWAVVRRGLSKARAARHDDMRALGVALAACAGLAASAPTVAPALDASPEPPEEVRLVTVAVAQELTDVDRFERLARDHGATVLRLARSSAVAIFGAEVTHGDEAARALQVAQTASFAAVGVGVATGHALRTVGRGAVEGLVDAAARLARHGGVTIDAATMELTRHRFVLRARGALGFEVVPDVVGQDETRPWQAPFVGRSAETAALADVALATARGPAAAVILGGAGTGKSRTLREAAARLRAHHPGARVLWARCDQLRRETPYAALREAIAAVDPLAADALSPARPAIDAQAFSDQARVAFVGVLRRLRRASLVVLVIDDALWLDEASSTLLGSLFRDPVAPPVALWLSGPPDARTALADVGMASIVCELAPLAPAAAAELVTALVGEAPEGLVVRGEGNPMFLEALALGHRSDLGREVPLTVEAAHRATLDRLDPAERELLKRASVLGRTAWLQALTDHVGAVALVGSLRRRGLIDTVARTRFEGCLEFEFRSALMADVARSLWSESELARRNALAATWLAARPDAEPAQVAQHLDRAGDAAGATEWWARAAELAARAGAVDVAHRYAARVLRPDTPVALRWRVLVAFDAALQQSGDRATQRRGLERLDALATGVDPAARCEVLWRWCHHARMVGDAARADEKGRRAIIEGGEGAHRWSVAARVELALLYADQGRLADGRAEAEAALRESPPLQDGWLEARVHHALAYVTLEEGRDFAAGLQLYLRAAEGYRRTGDLRRESIALANSAVALAQLGRFGDAIDAYDEARALALAVGNARSAAVCLEGRGSIRRCLGELEGADEDLAEALAEARRLAHPRLADAALAERVYVALAGGHPAEALRARLAEIEGVPGPGALAVRLRGRTRLGEDVTADLAQVAAVRAAHGANSLVQIELLVALWEARGGGAAEREAFAGALREYLESAADEGERRVRRRGVVRRFHVPALLLSSSD
jgi:tetratricopeptide (TPR) repeat protein